MADKMTNAQLHGCTFEGWQCFHCGEVFTTVGGAGDHFGATPNSKPGCLMKVQLGAERGLQAALRKAEAEVDRLEDENNVLQAKVDGLQTLAKLYIPDALPETGAKSGSCLWMVDDEGTWHSGCGNAFVFNDGGPVKNDMGYCCYCGLALLEHDHRGDPAATEGSSDAS